VVAVVCAVINGPLFLHDPSSFPTARLSEKLTILPAFVHAYILLPALALAIACASFLVAMTPSRVFGLMAVALGAMLYPVFLYELVANSFGAAALWTAPYSLPVTVFAGLWMCDTFGFDRPRHFF
jgi:hypothetical protein